MSDTEELCAILVEFLDDGKSMPATKPGEFIAMTPIVVPGGPNAERNRLAVLRHFQKQYPEKEWRATIAHRWRDKALLDEWAATHAFCQHCHREIAAGEPYAILWGDGMMVIGKVHAGCSDNYTDITEEVTGRPARELQ